MRQKAFLFYICDFGHAKMNSVSTVTKNRSDGSLPSGTVAYIAPERYQVETYGTKNSKEKREIAKKSDVFSYGVLLWEVRERQRPFKGMPHVAAHLHIKTGGELPKKTAYAPKGFNDIEDKCTLLDPTGRPSFAEVVSLLNHISTV
eukprot:m.151182 g.151182  ORF g.151182 m.151182 type:complete len:146 (+) comp38574_c0_seq16:2939-3376(+)